MNNKEYIKDYKNWKEGKVEKKPSPLDYKLKNEDFKKESMKDFDFLGADVSGSDFTLAELDNSGFKNVQGKGAIFVKAKIENSNLTSAEFDKSNFESANLQGSLLNKASLTKSNLTHTYFVNTDISGAKFNDSDLTGSVWTENLAKEALEVEPLLFGKNWDMSPRDLTKKGLEEDQGGKYYDLYVEVKHKYRFKGEAKEATLVWIFNANNVNEATLKASKKVVTDFSNTTFTKATMQRAMFSAIDYSKVDITELTSAINAILSTMRTTNQEDDKKWNKEKIEAVYKAVEIKGAILHAPNFEGSTFKYTNLRNARIINANMKDTKFIGADLKGADLSFSNLTGAEILGSDISNTIFFGANMKDVIMGRAVLEDQEVYGFNVAGTKIIEEGEDNASPTYAWSSNLHESKNFKNKFTEEELNIEGKIANNRHKV